MQWKLVHIARGVTQWQCAFFIVVVESWEPAEHIGQAFKNIAREINPVGFAIMELLNGS